VFVNGREQRVGFSVNCGVDERFRGDGSVAWILTARADRSAVPCCLSRVHRGWNRSDRRAGRQAARSFPAFGEAARYRTLAIPVRRARPALTAVRKSSRAARISVATSRASCAGRRTAPVLCRLDRNLLRHMTTLGLRMETSASRGDAGSRRHRAVGSTAYKQAVVRGYSGWLKAVARLGICRGVGQEVRSAYASLVCIADDDAQLFARLLREMYTLRGHAGSIISWSASTRAIRC